MARYGRANATKNGQNIFEVRSKTKRNIGDFNRLTLNIPVTSKIAKKTGQVKRVRSSKTTTVTNKRHKCERYGFILMKLKWLSVKLYQTTKF